MTLSSISTDSRRVLDSVWNEESHAAALDLIPTDFSIDDCFASSKRCGPTLMLDLIHLYKSCVPNIEFTISKQVERNGRVETGWTAHGHCASRILGRETDMREVRLSGAFVSESGRNCPLRILESNWDLWNFASSVGISQEEFQKALCWKKNDIKFRSYPGGSGNPLLIFPTLSLPGWIGWQRFMRKFSSSGELITFQFLGNRWALEGHKSVNDYFVKTETLAVERGLEAISISPPFDVLAHSAGGCVALDFAVRNPLSIRTMTLIEPAVPWVLHDAGAIDDALALYIDSRMKLYRSGLTEEQYAKFIQEAMPPHDRVDPRESPFWPDVAVYRENMKFRKAFYRHRDRLESLRALQFPVLLVKGKQSDDFHYRMMEVLKATLPFASLVQMKGGHSPQLGRGLNPFIRHFSSFLDCMASPRAVPTRSTN